MKATLKQEARMANGGNNGSSIIERLQLDYDKISESLVDYIKGGISLDVPKKRYSGTLYDVYSVNVIHKGGTKGATGGVLDKLILRHYMPKDKLATDYAGKIEHRKDLILYEATVLRGLDDFVPKYAGSNNVDFVLMEDLGAHGGFTLHELFSDKPNMRTAYGFDILEDVVARLAGFHEGLGHVVLTDFKNTTTPNYQHKFVIYIDELVKEASRDDIPDSEIKNIKNSFNEVAKVFHEGSLTGKYPSEYPIHGDLHLANVFLKEYKSENMGDRLVPYFIDFKPRVSPVQFDLVDLIKHPRVYPYFKDGGEAVKSFLQKYMVERIKAHDKRMGVSDEETEKKFNRNGFKGDALKDSLGMFHLSDFFKGIRSASKPGSLSRNNRVIFEQQLNRDKHYESRSPWYLGESMDALQILIANAAEYSLGDDLISSLGMMHNFFNRYFHKELANRNLLVNQLKIKEEDKI